MIRFCLRALFAVSILFLTAAVLTKSLPLPGTIPILMYHSIGSKEDAEERKHFVSQSSFSAQMAFLKLFGFRVISLDTYRLIQTGEMKPRGREIVITFDDGNETFMQEAWPILRRYEFPAAIFTVSESLKRQINGSMTAEDFKELLQSGMITVGSNTKTHPMLPEITDEAQLMEEVKGSKRDLEALLKTKVKYFSYPNGDLNARSLQAVRDSGYQLAFTTSHHKLGHLQETPYSITRLQITRNSDNPIVYWAKVIGLYQTHKHYWQKFKAWTR